MFRRTNKKNISAFFRNNTFPIINFMCLLTLIISPGRLGMPCSIMIILILATNSDVVQILKKDILFTVYITVNVLSCIAYIFNGLEPLLFIYAISYNFLPTLLYLIGAKHAYLSTQEFISKKIVYTCVFAMAFGLLFYFFKKEFYFEYIGQSLDVFAWGEYDYRFGSYFTSMILGSMCVTCVPLLVGIIHLQRKIVTIICIVSIALSLILCMQRSSWLVVMILMSVIFFAAAVKTPKKTIYIVVFGLCFVIAIFCLTRNQFFSEYKLRFISERISSMNIVSMMLERMEQWKAAIDVFFENPLGLGIGSFGHKAAERGLLACTDGNYFRILAETGIVGIVSFVGLIIKGIKMTIKNGKLCIFLALLGFCIQAVGTNVFDLVFCSYIFWFLLGYGNHCHRPATSKGKVIKDEDSVFIEC